MKRILAILFALTALVSMNAQEFIINNGAEPASLDALYTSGVLEHRIFMAFFEGLTILDPKTNKALPGVAEKWEISKDFKTYTFTLRNTAWTDGTKITAQTVVDSWIRKLDPKNAGEYASLLWDIVGAKAFNESKGAAKDVALKALSATKLEVKLDKPIPYFADMVSHQAFAIFPMHAIAKFGDQWTKPANFVGNGPFILKEWKPQEKIVGEKNPKYWDAKTVKLQKLTMLPIEDVNTGYQMYKAGQVDWNETAPSELAAEYKLRPDFHVEAEYGTYYYLFNVTKKPFDDARVRKALSMAFDRKALVENVTKTGQVPAFSFIPPGGGYTPSKGLGYNVEEAKKLLSAAGYADGKGFPAVQLLYNTSSNHKRVAEFIQSEWKKNLGIDITLVNQEWATYLDSKDRGDFQIARAGWIADYLDPSTFYNMFVTGNSDNDGLYDSKAYNDAVQLANTSSGAARLKAITDAEKVLIEQDHAVMPIYFYVSQNFIDMNKWDGWYPNPMNVHHWKFIAPKAKK